MALLVGGGAAGALLLFRGSTGNVDLPGTAAGLRSSVATCERYLNADGRNLARGRARGASVYSVKARLDPVANTVSADQVVLFTNRSGVELEKLVLRVYANGAGVRQPGREVIVRSASVGGRDAAAELKGSILTVTPASPLAPGAETLVSFSFEEHVPLAGGALAGLEGLLAGDADGGYGVFGHDRKIYDLGYFIPLLTTFENGRWNSREVPPFGDAADYDCAYFNVSLEVPAGWKVAGSGFQTGTSRTGERLVYAFAGGPLRDFALQASPDYRSVSRTVGYTTVTSWYLAGAEAGGERAAAHARDALAQYNRHFGRYPYTRLNICQAALGGGVAGMEFSGLIQISRTLYGGLLPEVNEPGERFDNLLDRIGGSLLGDTLEFVIAHEVCHQWWGLAVGSDSIEHPWQDESLTNYCGILHFRWLHGKQAADRQLQLRVTLPYQAASMMGGCDEVVDSPVGAFKNQEQYTAIVYSKGALFFKELEEKIGTPAFERGLARYYRDYAFLSAAPEDLVRALQEASDDAGEVTELHRRWIKEKHADEDIAIDLPGADLFNDLFKDLPELDLGPYRDMLRELMEEFDPRGDHGSPAPPAPGESPEVPI